MLSLGPSSVRDCVFDCHSERRNSCGSLGKMLCLTSVEHLREGIVLIDKIARLVNRGVALTGQAALEGLCLSYGLLRD